jgi:hypothetical protein
MNARVDSRGPHYCGFGRKKFYYTSGHAPSRRLAKRKAQQHLAKGRGLKELINFRPRNNAPPKVRKFLEDNKGVDIEKIKIGRKPVIGNIQKALDLFSFGNFSKVKKSLGYNDIYHNYLLVELKNGKKVKIEKNHVVDILDAKDADYKNAHNVPVTKKIDIDGLIGNASKNDPNFYKYDPRSKNCQYFTKEVVEKNGLHSDRVGEEYLKPQNGEALIDSLGPLKGLPKAVTDFASGVDRVLNGNGKKKRKRKRIGRRL